MPQKCLAARHMHAARVHGHVVHCSCTGKPSNNERQSGTCTCGPACSDNAFIAIHCLPKVRRGSCVFLQLDVLYVLSQLKHLAIATV